MRNTLRALFCKYFFPKLISVKVPPDAEEELETAPPEAAAAAAAHPDEPHVVEVEVEAWFIRLPLNIIQYTINDHIFYLLFHNFYYIDPILFVK